eukprot:s2356_g6.t2
MIWPPLLPPLATNLWQGKNMVPGSHPLCDETSIFDHVGCTESDILLCNSPATCDALCEPITFRKRQDWTMVAMGRSSSSCRRFLCLGFLLTISLNCLGFLSGKTVSPGSRQRVRPCEAMPEAMPEERKFSNERLRAETEDPFAKVKVALFGFLTITRMCFAVLGDDDRYASVDQPNFWDQVYKVQTERDIYEWYGLGYDRLRPYFVDALKELTPSKLDLSDFGDASFGAVVDKGLSDCIGSVGARQQYFQDLRRVLVDGGRLLVVSQRRLQTQQDESDDFEELCASQQLLRKESDLGDGWVCRREELYGSLFVENDPKQPPFPQPGTDHTIAYFLLICTKDSESANDADGLKASLAMEVAGAGVGLLFILPRLLGTLLGAPRASPLEKVLTDLGINFGAMIFLGFLTYQEWNGESVRSQAKEEGALIARLPVQVNLNGKDVDVKLSDLRNGRQLLPRRPVICIGNEQFCLDCIDASQKVSEAMARCDFLLIPVLSTTNGRTAVSEAAQGKSFVALPKDSEDWQLLQEIQLAQVRSQGLDEATGQAIIVKKNGRVGTRFLGVPDWNSLTQEVDARVQIGLDTDNI